VVVDQHWLWPAVAIAGAVLAAVAAAFAAATVHRWPTAAKKADRYDMRSGALAWDALDDGDDPTLDDDDSRKTE
ncbi:Trp biosynthesis-associated membrane protein, partial [Agrococcus casei]